MGFSTRLGKYELGREIGEGRFAKVRVARNIETGLKVAVKIIDKKMVFSLNLRHQVKREISTMNLVKHPNIVRLYEVLASKNKIYLVMEYVTGGDLSDKIAYRQKITEEEAKKYFHQLIDAVDHCHRRHVYHRDLKPQNLLLDGKDNLMVSDFGLSILHQTDPILSTSCGSPNYIAPEVIVSQNYNRAAADIWSCGVTFFELLAGFSPFEDSSQIEQYHKICKAEFSFPSWFSYGARNLIAKILDPIPKSNDVECKKRVGSRLSAKETIEKIDAAIKSLGWLVKTVNPCKIKIQGAKEIGKRGSYLSVSTEVTEVAPSFSMVEIWKSAGDTVEYIKFYKSFSRVLMDVHNCPKNVQLDCPTYEEDNHLISASC